MPVWKLYLVGYLVGYLRYLFFLQGLRHVDEVGGVAAVYSFVEVSHGAYAHDVLPAVMLLEYLKHLVLPGHFAQHTGIFERRDAQQHTVVIFF